MDYFSSTIDAIQRQRWHSSCTTESLRVLSSGGLHDALLREDPSAAVEAVRLCLLRNLRSIEEPLTDATCDELRRGGVADALLHPGRTPVMTAVCRGLMPALHLLRQAGASFTCVCKEEASYSPLHYAVREGRDDMVRYMLPLLPKRQLLARTASGDTALHLAARLGHSHLIAAFLEHASRLHAEDVFVWKQLRQSSAPASARSHASNDEAPQAVSTTTEEPPPPSRLIQSMILSKVQSIEQCALPHLVARSSSLCEQKGHDPVEAMTRIMDAAATHRCVRRALLSIDGRFHAVPLHYASTPSMFACLMAMYEAQNIAPRWQEACAATRHVATSRRSVFASRVSRQGSVTAHGAATEKHNHNNNGSSLHASERGGAQGEEEETLLGDERDMDDAHHVSEFPLLVEDHTNSITSRGHDSDDMVTVSPMLWFVHTKVSASVSAPSSTTQSLFDQWLSLVVRVLEDEGIDEPHALWCMMMDWPMESSVDFGGDGTEDDDNEETAEQLPVTVDSPWGILSRLTPASGGGSTILTRLGDAWLRASQISSSQSTSDVTTICCTLRRALAPFAQLLTTRSATSQVSQTFLHFACETDHVMVVQWLRQQVWTECLEPYLNSWLIMSHTSTTTEALPTTTIRSAITILQVVIDVWYGAVLQPANRDGYTPLMLACHLGSAGVISELTALVDSSSDVMERLSYLAASTAFRTIRAQRQQARAAAQLSASLSSSDVTAPAFGAAKGASRRTSLAVTPAGAAARTVSNVKSSAVNASRRSSVAKPAALVASGPQAEQEAEELRKQEEGEIREEVKRLLTDELTRCFSERTAPGQRRNERNVKGSHYRHLHGDGKALCMLLVDDAIERLSRESTAQPPSLSGRASNATPEDTGSPIGTSSRSPFDSPSSGPKAPQESTTSRSPNQPSERRDGSNSPEPTGRTSPSHSHALSRDQSPVEPNPGGSEPHSRCTSPGTTRELQGSVPLYGKPDLVTLWLTARHRLTVENLLCQVHPVRGSVTLLRCALEAHAAKVCGVLLVDVLRRYEEAQDACDRVPDSVQDSVIQERHRQGLERLLQLWLTLPGDGADSGRTAIHYAAHVGDERLLESLWKSFTCLRAQTQHLVGSMIDVASKTWGPSTLKTKFIMTPSLVQDLHAHCNAVKSATGAVAIGANPHPQGDWKESPDVAVKLVARLGGPSVFSFCCDGNGGDGGECFKRDTINAIAGGISNTSLRACQCVAFRLTALCASIAMVGI